MVLWDVPGSMLMRQSLRSLLAYYELKRVQLFITIQLDSLIVLQ